MHWADVEARHLLSKGREQLISSGITPSGFIHVGSLREAITANVIRKALTEAGADASMIYLVDSFDPLRRRYDFLTEEFEAEVQKPLSHVPSPCGECPDYASHFIRPFLDSLEELGVDCDVHWTHDLYANGDFAEAIDTVITNREKVIEILREVTGREIPGDYFPYNPRCKERGCYVTPKILGYEYPYVHFQCDCGEERADIRTDDGKLPWRIEWAAKWKIFGVTCEPFGKDHAAAGGSYDTGERFAREVFGIDPPHPVAYEFVQLKGQGQMHKSSGSVVTGIDALRITPAEVLNFSIIRYNPDRHIDYDPGMGILDAVDEYDRYERLYYLGGASEVEEDLLRAYELAQPKGVRDHLPVQIPYRHLVSVVQIGQDLDSILEILKRTEQLSEMDQKDMELLRKRVDCVKYWLNTFAPDMVRFELSDKDPGLDLSPEERGFLECLRSTLSQVQWEGDEIHDSVYECAKSNGVGAKKGFKILYRIFIDQKSGPRLGHFLSTLDRGYVRQRLDRAL
ncbi:MAG: lysine--tRNA ligase [Methanomassiliicoccales archaeon]